MAWRPGAADRRRGVLFFNLLAAAPASTFKRHGKVINFDGDGCPVGMDWGLSQASPEDLRQLHDVING